MIPHLGFHPELVSYVSTGDLFTCSHLLSYRTSYQGSVRQFPIMARSWTAATTLALSGRRRVIGQDVLNPGYESCDFLVVVLTQHHCFTLGGRPAVELRQQRMVAAAERPAAPVGVDLIPSPPDTTLPGVVPASFPPRPIRAVRYSRYSFRCLAVGFGDSIGGAVYSLGPEQAGSRSCRLGTIFQNEHIRGHAPIVGTLRI